MALKEYRDPILKKLIDMLETEGPAELAGHYIYGDTLAPPRSRLPIVSVARDTSRVGSDGTMQDRRTHTITMAIIVDYTKDLNESFDLSRGTTTLYRLIEESYEDETDPNYLAVKPKTIVYALRNNLKLADNLFISIRNDDELSIDYKLGIEKRGSGIWSVEGILRFSMESTQARPGLYPS